MKFSIFPVLALFLACATPKAFNLTKSSASPDQGRSIVIGKVQNASGQWIEPDKRLLLGARLVLIVNGVESAYDNDDQGFFAVKVENGVQQSLSLGYRWKGSGNTGAVQYSANGGANYPVLTNEKSLNVVPGKINIIPIHIVSLNKLSGNEIKPVSIDDGSRNGEILAWFKKAYPKLAAQYPD